MNVTFLIGNGFDLGIGLKTAYTDFFAVYCSKKEGDTPLIDSFKKQLQDDYETWSDFEKAFGEYAGQALDADCYLKVFEDFEVEFSDYLRNEEKNFDNSKIELIAEKMKTALISYYDIRPADREALVKSINGRQATFNFISFNYTKCLDECIGILRRQPDYVNSIRGNIQKPVHVHGYTEENMILGVNDETQIKSEILAKNEEVIEEIVKPVQNQIARMNYDNDATRIIRGSDIICVYGMSIGETDKKWWELVMNWLQESSSNRLIILQHRENARFTFNWNRLVKEIRRRLFSYGSVPDEKRKTLEQRIHIAVNHDIFTMDLRKAPIEVGEVCESLL